MNYYKLLSMLTNALIAISILFCKLHAQSIAVVHRQEYISVQVLGINYPSELLLLELKSGLPNTIDLMLNVTAKSMAASEIFISYIVTYDLWDEHYLVEQIRNEERSTFTVLSDDSLFSLISSVTFKDVMSTKAVHDNEINVSFRVTFNPVKHERIKQIQRWIKESNGFDGQESNSSAFLPAINLHSTRSSNRFNTSSNQSSGKNSIISIERSSSNASSGPKFQRLFDRILEDNFSEDSIAADWKGPITNATFYLNQLNHE